MSPIQEETNYIFPSAPIKSANASRYIENNSSNSRDQLSTLYESLRGSLFQTEFWWRDDKKISSQSSSSQPSINLTCLPTSAGFSSLDQCEEFCGKMIRGCPGQSVSTSNPLAADYVSRFNNQLTRVACIVDREQGAVHETLIVKTLFQPSWSPWMLGRDPSACPATVSVVLSMQLSVWVKENKLLKVLWDWNQMSLFQQLGLLALERPKTKPNGQHVHSMIKVEGDLSYGLPDSQTLVNRLIRPTLGNCLRLDFEPLQCQSISNTVQPMQSIKMREVLTDQPSPNQKTPIKVNPAMISHPEELFIQPSERAIKNQADDFPIPQSTFCKNPVFVTHFELGDGSDLHPIKGAVPKEASLCPMGTLLDAPVKILPSRGLNERFQVDLYGTNLESRVEPIRPLPLDDPRFKSSSVFYSTDEDEETHFSKNSFGHSVRGSFNDNAQDIPTCSIDMNLSTKARFDSHVFDALSIADEKGLWGNDDHSSQQHNPSLQAANKTRFASSIIPPDQLLAIEQQQKKIGEHERMGVVFGQSTPIKSSIGGGRFNVNASSINFDYYDPKKDK